MHQHHDEDELWYVAEGDYVFKAGDKRMQTCAGGMALGPRGLPQ